MMRNGALLLAVAACLVAGAAAVLPDEFANAGMPPYIVGSSYDWDPAKDSVTAMGLNYNDTYSFAAIVDGRVETEIATYTSWECGPSPGAYWALLLVKTMDSDGAVIAEKEVCELGVVYDDLMKSMWAQSETECPTKATEENRFLGEHATPNACGTPPPLADGAPATGPSLADLLAEDLADAAPPAA
ncbi:ABC transporter [Micractinium conductrix]|uniref:ABC transporter n=1 Tax=Micractinium conductrix TaxID=554055 RepID=A0A2P6V3H6_9CHLO|nr:ABC transporter [Micractinium conductrix]|eukprot:PSC68640.1 ABC transporter [Micractinium conductrix]